MASSRSSVHAGLRQGSRYSVRQANGRISVKRDSLFEAGPEHEILVDVPPGLVAVLKNNMTRLLQLFRHWDLENLGGISMDDFERALRSLGGRYTRAQVRRLFQVLDADGNGFVSLDELLLLKLAIDAEITHLPMLPTQQSYFGEAREAILRLGEPIEDAASARQPLLGRLLEPVLGVVWKDDIRPHHALDLSNQWQRWMQGPAAVHAPLRPCRDPSRGPGFHVSLQLVVKRGPLHGERQRYTYSAGPVGPAEPFADAMHHDLQAAAEHAAEELGAFLAELRQMDLKAEEVRLSQRGDDAARTVDAIRRLRHEITALAADTEAALVAQTRFTREEYAPTELVGCPKTARFATELAPWDGHRRWIGLVSRVCAILLVATVIFDIVVNITFGAQHFSKNHAACEFMHFACNERPWQYECNKTAGTVERLHRHLSPNDHVISVCADIVPPYDWGEPLLNLTCHEEVQQQSWWLLMPAPFLFASAVALPIGLFHKNAHRTAVLKVLLWTPSVPLILVQCFLRFVILASIVSTAADAVYACLVSIEAFILMCQVAVFLFMDAMRLPTPVLRIALALVLLLRFGASLAMRTFAVRAAEQAPLLKLDDPLRSALLGLGASTKQSIVASIDWTVIVLLTSSILSVLNYPAEMAVVRLRCDTRGYFNWRDQYLGAMAVRAHHRGTDANDIYLGLRAQADRRWEKHKVNAAHRKARWAEVVSDPQGAVATLRHGLSRWRARNSRDPLTREGSISLRSQDLHSIMEDARSTDQDKSLAHDLDPVPPVPSMWAG